MDDILIFGGQTKEQYPAIVVQILNILYRHCLYLKAEKCTFGQPMVEYLSLILSEGQVEMEPIKVASVCDWLTPTSVTKVQSFVGFVKNTGQIVIQCSGRNTEAESETTS